MELDGPQLDGRELDGMELDGPAAPPLINGELAFDEPWQGRIFSIAQALSAQGCYEWDEFRDYLIRDIRTWEDNADGLNTTYAYYDRFLAALTALLSAKGLCRAGELGARSVALANRPHGHAH
jgi:nitrile hydratase accessory protein